MNLQLARLTSSVQDDLDQVERAIAFSLKSDNLYIRQIVDYMAGANGKRLRPALALLSAKAFGEVAEPVVALAASLEMIHVATLIHDDIIDHSDVRRKQKTLNSKWGNEISVLMGDYVLASTFHLMSRNLPKEVLEILSDATKVICRGEISETFHRFNPDLTEEQYYEVVREKTASLIAVSCQTGAVLSGADDRVADALYRYGLGIGMAFQLVDDTLDFEGESGKFGKPVLADFKEGKLTLPVLHCMKVCAKPERTRLRRLIVKRSKTSGDLRFLMGLLSKYQSLRYSRGRAKDFASEASLALDLLEGNRVKNDLLEYAKFFVHRDF